MALITKWVIAAIAIDPAAAGPALRFRRRRTSRACGRPAPRRVVMLQSAMGARRGDAAVAARPGATPRYLPLLSRSPRRKRTRRCHPTVSAAGGRHGGRLLILVSVLVLGLILLL